VLKGQTRRKTATEGKEIYTLGRVNKKIVFPEGGENKRWRWWCVKSEEKRRNCNNKINPGWGETSCGISTLVGVSFFNGAEKGQLDDGRTRQKEKQEKTSTPKKIPRGIAWKKSPLQRRQQNGPSTRPRIRGKNPISKAGKDGKG